jgi:hypothetical protein
MGPGPSALAHPNNHVNSHKAKPCHSKQYGSMAD